MFESSISKYEFILKLNSGASTVFNLGLNVQYSISTDANWLNVNSSKAQGTITASTKSANIGNSPRTADIYIKGGYSLQVVTVTQGITLGINDNVISEFQIYPNPTFDKLNIELNNRAKTISIYSITGIEVMKIEKNQINDKLIQLDVSSLSKGMYFIKIKSENKTTTKKFIKQ